MVDCEAVNVDAGLSVPQASQRRKFGGLDRVHILHDQFCGGLVSGGSDCSGFLAPLNTGAELLAWVPDLGAWGSSSDSKSDSI